MSRTQKRYLADQGMPDGHWFIPVLPSNQTNNTTTPLTVLNRQGAGDVGMALIASKTYQFMMPLSGIFRYGMQDDLQESFGSSISNGADGLAVGSPATVSAGTVSAGLAVNIAVKSSVSFVVGQWLTIDTVASGVQEFAQISAIPDATHITVESLANGHTTPFPIAANTFTTPAGVSGPPPFTGVTQLTPVTAPRPKGIKFMALYPWYSIATNPLTSQTIGLTQLTAAQSTANAEVDILALAQNGLALSNQATPHLTPIPIPVANQTYRTLRYTEYVIEWNIVTPASCTGVVYGVFLDVHYNYQ